MKQFSPELLDGPPSDSLDAISQKRGVCPCQFDIYWENSDSWADWHRHALWHMEWEGGVWVPPAHEHVTINDIARIQASAHKPLVRIPARLARLMQRENHYDFPLFYPNKKTSARAYVAIVGNHAIGAAFIDDTHRFGRWNEADANGTINFVYKEWAPMIVGIFVCAGWRRRGVARQILTEAARQENCTVAELAWSLPLSDAGEALAMSLTPIEALRVSA